MLRCPALAVILLALSAGPAVAQRFLPVASGLPVGPPGTASDAGWSGLAIARVDGDPVPDVVCAGRKGTGARVFRYQGAGAFLESSLGLFRPISGRSEVAVADFNQDGLMDIVEADFGGHFQLVDGSFVAMPNAGWSFSGEGIAAGDVNQDGIADVVVTGHLSGTMRVLLGDGFGNWIDFSAGLPATPTGSIGGGRKCRFVDIDGDGDLDLIAILYFNSGVWLNNWPAPWTPASNGLPVYTSGGDYYAVDAADFNNDGWPDLVFSDFTGANNAPVPVTATVFLGNGGTFWAQVPVTGIPPGLTAGDVAAADVTGDGLPDIVIGVRGVLGPGTAAASTVLVFAGQGNGTFVYLGDTGLPLHPDVPVTLFQTDHGRIEALDVADLNLDGLNDIVYGAYRFGVFGFLQNGAMPYGPGTAGSGGLVPTARGSGGMPFLGNSAFGLQLANALGGAGAILGLADRPGPVALPGFPGSPLLIDPGTSSFFILLTGVTGGVGPGSGSWLVPAPIPAVPSLLGAAVLAQFAVLDPGATGGAAFTNGLRVVLGF
jgi:hypothetical protein